MMIKLVFSCCALAIALALPLDAFALQGENIAFERLDSGPGSTLVRVGDEVPIEEADGDETASAGFSFTSGAISLNQRADAKILSPINEPVFIPNHCVSIAQGGNLDLGPEDNADVRLRGGALAWARYATCLLYTSPSPRDRG